jgi:hypothetical protein
MRQVLESEMRQVLAEMSLLQYGRTQAFAASSGDTERDPRPAGEACPLAEKWLREWQRNPCEDTLLMARAELDAWKRSVPRDIDQEYDFEQWVVDDGKGYAAEQVAGKFGVAVSRVVRIRLRHGRDGEFGMPTTPETRAERQDKSRERIACLASQGMTVRQIHTITEVPRETVRRWMKGAA